MIQLTDDEKYFHKHEDNLESYHRYAMENAKDIIACEFNLDKTFIFINTDYMGYMYKNVCRF